MSASLVSTLFATTVLAVTAWQLLLAGRQASAAQAGRPAVPPAFAGRITLDAHQKAADYTAAKMALERNALPAGAAWLLLLTLGGGFERLHDLVDALGLGPVAGGTLFLMLALFLLGLVDLPFTVWRTFRIEARFGFNRTTPGTFVADQLKSMALGIALGAPLAACALWLMARLEDSWWIAVAALWTGFMLALAWIFPRWIAPIFNRFQPLPDEALRARIEALLRRNGFAASGVFVMDGSRRSSHGNAYFTGLGREKRIVFFDTLLERLSHEEIEAVLAHELGHFRHRHVLRRMSLTVAAVWAGLALLAWLEQQPAFFAGLGLDRPGDAAALLLFLVAAPPFLSVISPLFAALSRRDEFQADAFAAQQVGARPMIDALLKLYRDNAATLTPDRLYSAVHDSHPPAPVRIARLEATLEP